MSEPVRTCPGQKWEKHPCEPSGCPTPGACSASKGIDELRAKLAAVEAQKDDQLRLVAALRAEICELLSCHIDTPNLGRDALRRLRDFIDQRRAALAQKEQANG